MKPHDPLSHIPKEWNNYSPASSSTPSDHPHVSEVQSVDGDDTAGHTRDNSAMAPYSSHGDIRNQKYSLMMDIVVVSAAAEFIWLLEACLATKSSTALPMSALCAKYLIFVALVALLVAMKFINRAIDYTVSPLSRIHSVPQKKEKRHRKSPSNPALAVWSDRCLILFFALYLLFSFTSLFSVTSTSNDLLRISLHCLLVPVSSLLIRPPNDITNKKISIYVMFSLVYCGIVFGFLPFLLDTLGADDSLVQVRGLPWLDIFAGRVDVKARPMILYGLLYMSFHMHRAFIQAAPYRHLQSNEHMLLQSNGLLEALLSQLPCLLWTVNDKLVYTMVQGIDCGFSRETKKMVGHHLLEATTILGRPREYLEDVERLYREVLTTGVPKQLTLQNKEKTMKSFVSPYKNAEGKTVGLVCVALDITQQQQIQQALQQSETQYRNLLDAISDHIFHVDRSGRIQFVNRDFLGTPKAAFSGRSFCDLFSASHDMHRRAILAFRSVFEEQKQQQLDWCCLTGDESGACFDDKSVSEEELRTMTLEGKLTFFSTKISPIMTASSSSSRNSTPIPPDESNLVDGQATVTGAIVSVVDVTQTRSSVERQREIETIRATSRRLQEFINHLAHEIRNPLQTVVGGLQLLSVSGELNEQQRELHEAMTENSKHLISVLNDVLDIEKASQNKIVLHDQPCNLLELLESVVDSQSLTARRRCICLSSSFDLRIPELIVMDRTRLHQIFANLLSNSLKFSNPGSAVHLQTDLISDDVTTVTVAFSVCDSGIGMDLQRNKLFEPFIQQHREYQRQAPQEYQGIGIGMSIVRHLLDLMGGTIGVESSPGCGTNIKIQLTMPKVDQQSLQNFESDQTQLRVQQSQYNSVLFVMQNKENEKANSIIEEAIRHLLGQLGVSSVTTLVSNYSTPLEDIIYTAQQYEVLLIEDTLMDIARVALRSTNCRVLIMRSTSAPVALAQEDLDDRVDIVKRPLKITQLSKVLQRDYSLNRQRRSGSVKSDMSSCSSLNSSNDGEAVAAAPGAPTSASTTPRPSRPSSPSLSPSTSTSLLQTPLVRILVVDDSFINLRVIVQLLRRVPGLEKANIATAANGQEAVSAVVAADSKPFDLILMDLMMPVMNGFEATKRIRALARDGMRRVPIVAVTANSDRETGNRCNEAGFDDILIKPITVAELSLIVKKHLPSNNY